MYLGRIVAIGMTKEGKAAAMYRVSSRSFPNREAVLGNQQVAIMPRPGFEDDLRKNPYITYNCIRLTGEWAVATNGSQTDPIVEKLAMGYPARDAIALPLLAMDYEKDSLDTPRIVAVVGSKCRKGYLGIVRRDALLVREFDLVPGQVRYLSTYEKNRPCDDQVTGDFDGTCAHCAVNYVVDGGIFADFTNPVTSAAAVAEGDGYELAVRVI
ncbi:IMP cyclohydrolase [Victivallaceae bacterium BBE-744-WT-12]|jgi:IMP cyclohydrolase|uniref:IMP cyclohydrolase n=1 Tax=Victivallis lenta TaxID=2606640 RepID=A0A844G588_9BACT|nr:IMP cyclohydrolase [Victivallis lenta]AVM45599.1 IMP cyclohydrolase [Victivallales bacterium CCUG 44730]MBS1452629.1 IMP cyclohydrolase [Lentisphaeria bacterium]MBS5529455.1 IMP cyclohydrolase [bacterium]MST98526.1 IMP cyclohydrolase [Victivallis lenta]HBP06741.1 IMP cyclohydrolase [Lentisphaeria bacterium]